jgi:hypothetical protein
VDAIGWVILAVVVIVVIAAVAWVMMQRKRTTTLRETFGSEYDRTMQRTGDRRVAESELDERRARREGLDIRPLDPTARQRYASRWNEVQARFVDDPRGALDEADQLVIVVMGERGYPMDDFDDRASTVSVDHPDVVENYRAAHTISQRATGSMGASTEEMRQGLVHYRALFAELLQDGQPSDLREAR